MNFIIQNESGMYLKSYSVSGTVWTNERAAACRMSSGRAKTIAVCALSCKVKILEV